MNKKIIKAGMGYTIGNFLLKGLSVLSLPLFSRLLSIEDYGIFSVYLSYESILYIFIGLALHSCIKTAKYKFDSLFNVFISSIVGGVCLNFLGFILLANTFYSYYKNAIGFSLFIVNCLLIYSFGSAILTIYNVYIGIEYKYKKYLMLTSFNAVFNITLSLILIKTVFSENGYLGRIVGTAVPIIFISCYILIFFFRQEKPIINKEYYKFALKYSLPIIPHSLSQVVLSQSDRIMINIYIDSTATGLYSFAFYIYAIVSIVVQSVCSVWEPWAFEQLAKGDYGTLKKYGNLFSIIIFFLTAFAILVSPELIRILGPASYEASKFVAIPILLGGFFSSIYNIPCILEYYNGKTKMIAIGTVIAAAINLILNYIFINAFGYIAAAFTTMITYVLYFSFHYFISYKISNFYIIDKRNLYIESIFLGVIAILSWIFIDKLWLRWSGAVLLGISFVYIIFKEWDLKSKKVIY